MRTFFGKGASCRGRGYNPQVGTLDKRVQGCGNKQSQHGFPVSHRFFHKNAVYQLEETIFMIVQSEHVPFGCLSRRRPEPDAKWRNITQLLKQISHGERQRWGMGAVSVAMTIRS